MSSLRFENDGGPLIALDTSLANHWQGNRSEDYSDPIPPGSDYERACNARGVADILKVGGGDGVVIGTQEGISTAWWHRLKSGGVCLVGAIFGDNAADAQLRAILDKDIADDKWQLLGTVSVKSGRLLLMHAASEGATVTVDPPGSRACIEDGVTVGLACGEYEVLARELKLEDEALYNLVQWRRIARAA